METSFVTIRAALARTKATGGASRACRSTSTPRCASSAPSGVEARVVNISERGFMAVTEARFEVGSRVWLMLPGRERANAVVKWIAGDKIGAEFAEPISLDGLPI